MKKSKLLLNVLMAIFGLSFVLNTGSVQAQSVTQATPTNGNPAAVGSTNCAAEESSSFLGLPTWYRGLPSYTVDGVCQIFIEEGSFEALCTDQAAAEKTLDEYCGGSSGATNPILIIALNIFDILLRVAGLIAVIFIVIGGFKFVMSEGNPQSAQAAKQTVINALIGAVIAVMASVVVAVVVRVVGI